MHIWYIHHYGGGPGVGSYDRPYQLAKAWSRQGHSTTVFIADHHHLLEKGFSPPLKFAVNEVSYVALPTSDYSGNGIDRLRNIWNFCRQLNSVDKRHDLSIPSPDAIVASSPHPFTIFPAQRLARRHNAKLVFEIRDIWPLSITEILGTSRLHPFVQLCAAAERFALNNSDLVASVLPRADQYLADRGYGAKPFVWVPNGIDTQATGGTASLGSTLKPIEEKLSEWGSQKKTKIIYTGSIGKPNALDLLLDAVAYGSQQGEAEKCGVLIVGDGEQLSPLKSRAERLSLRNVYFSGRIPKHDTISIVRKADIGYAGLRNIAPLFRYGVSPNKIADYFNASLPVILPIAPCGDPVSESGGGVAQELNTPEALWGAIRNLVCLPSVDRQALGAQGRAYITTEYDYDRISDRYIKAINAVKAP